MTGIFLDELATDYPRALVRSLIRDELDQGRVVCDEVGRFQLVASAFEPGVIPALRRIATVDLDHSSPGRKRRVA